MITVYNGNKLLEECKRRRERLQKAMQGMKYFCFDVNYDNGPDVFEYFFRAKSEEEVSEATGVALEYIYPATEAAIQAARRHGRHIDTVINGRLIEEEYF